MRHVIGITTALSAYQWKIKQLAQQYGLVLCQQLDEYLFVIDLRCDGLYVQWNTSPVMYFHLDYLSGRSAYRRHTSGRRHLLSRALGLHKVQVPKVIDCTAGWGEDSLLMASWGCRVLMLERCAPVVCLLQDALDRMPDNHLKGTIDLQHVDAQYFLSKGEYQADIIYLDPMFEGLQQKSKVKKPMQLLRAWLVEDGGEEEGTKEKEIKEVGRTREDVSVDHEKLLDISLVCAKKRVVVKRHLHAPSLGRQKPSYACGGKNTRYDVYVIA